MDVQGLHPRRPDGHRRALLLVDGKSNIKTFEDWVEFAKSKGKVVVGGIGTVNVDFILQSLIAEHAGYEIEYVPYNEEGQVQTSLLVAHSTPWCPIRVPSWVRSSGVR